MKFKLENWRDMPSLPCHEGQYEVKLANGEVIRADFVHGTWSKNADGATHWRGLRLKGMKKPKPHQRTLNRYRGNDGKTHAKALKSAMFLARRAVSLDHGEEACKYYAVAHALDPMALATVDAQWLQRYGDDAATGKQTLEKARSKAAKFLEKRGGRPA